MQSIEGEIQELQEKLTHAPQSFLFARLADLYLRKNELAEAISVCEQGVQKHSHYVAGHFVLGKCYFEDNKLDQAESEFNRVLLYDPEHLGTFYYQARIMKARSWNNAYLLWLKRILEIDPLDTHAQSLVEEYEAQTAGETEVVVPVPPGELERKVIQEEAVSPEPSDQEVKEVLGQFAEPEKAELEEMTPLETKSTSEEKISEPVPEMDEEEKFSYILDDIFKNEVVDEEKLESIEQTAPPADEEEIISAIREKVERVEKEEAGSDEEETKEEGIPEKTVEAEEPVSEEEEPEKTIEAKEPVAEKEEGEKEKSEPIEEKKAENESSQPAAAPKEPIVTPTLGEIYAAQGHFDKAIGVYEILLRKDPTNQTYIEKVEYLKKKLEESKGKEEE